MTVLRFSRNHLLDCDVMFPFIAIVKEIIDFASAFQMMPEETFAGKHSAAVFQFFLITHSNTAVITFKAVKVVVVPSEN